MDIAGAPESRRHDERRADLLTAATGFVAQAAPGERHQRAYLAARHLGSQGVTDPDAAYLLATAALDGPDPQDPGPEAG